MNVVVWVRAGSGQLNPAGTEPSGLSNPPPSTEGPRALQRLRLKHRTAPRVGGKITPGDGQHVSPLSSLIHHLSPQKIQGMVPPGDQDSAKFPSIDSKAANPAGCWHSPDTHSPCSSSSKSLTWEALGRAEVTAEPSLNHTEMERALFAPAEHLLGLPDTCSSSTQPQDLISRTQATPVLGVPARSPARIPQNHVGSVIREGFTQIFPFFHMLKPELHQLLLRWPSRRTLQPSSFPSQFSQKQPLSASMFTPPNPALIHFHLQIIKDNK